METDHKIDIQVNTQYLDSQSEPSANQFAFAYTITISNEGSEKVQLISRKWLITDAEDQTQVVEGDGVIGEQPVILPGTSYTYTSGAILTTPNGHMEGHYNMIDAGGDSFIAPIPAFSLARPGSLH